MNKIAVALWGANNDECIAELDRLAPSIGAAEIRLDMMESFDVEGLIANSPVELIVTYRPVREGGKFDGDEAERLSVLRRAVEAGAAYIDIEADAINAVAGWGFTRTKLIVSKHWWDAMPPDLVSLYKELRDRADIVKLVGTASRVADTAPVFELAAVADTPVIVLAMGEAGLLTRALTPSFAHSLFTYAAARSRWGTAPGQLSVEEMVALGADTLGPAESIEINVGATWSVQRNDSTLTFEVAGDETDVDALRAVVPPEWTVSRSR